MKAKSKGTKAPPKGAKAPPKVAKRSIKNLPVSSKSAQNVRGGRIRRAPDDDPLIP